MALVRANATAITLDPTELDLGLIATGGLTGGGAVLSPPTVFGATPAALQLEYSVNGGAGGKYIWNLIGTGLTYSPAFLPKGFPAPDITGGTLTGLFDQINTTPASINISGISLPAATFWSQVKADDNLGILTSMLAGDDTIVGSNQQVNAAGQTIGDHLFGYAGNDHISAGAGFDILNGGPGNDFLDGGPDTDQAVYGGDAAQYHIVTYAGTTGVVSNPAFSVEGVDKLVNIEQLVFAGQTVATPGDNFSPLDYIASYADLSAALGANAQAGFDHYLYAGANEGRTVSFDGLEYIASYPDLIAAFGANDAAGATHYIQGGAAEGRHVTFDGLEYIASYADLIQGLGVNADAGTVHFITHGAAEHRTVIFDPISYELANPDVAAVFGADLLGATVHYITTGFYEHRPIA
ncbi:MAG: hypothetical protein U1E63_16435 [Burkholderiales bacterium]